LVHQEREEIAETMDVAGLCTVGLSLVLLRSSQSDDFEKKSSEALQLRLTSFQALGRADDKREREDQEKKCLE
jgi:hypothetical protein